MSIVIDKDRYYKYEKNILEKSNSDKERQVKIDREKVFELFKNGTKKSDIAKILKASKGTISDIINKNL
jgi:DNA invertase Pin-like site-specific DNA recombinase